jgi:signal transduction protein with GAF and PtsI domain
VSLPVQNVTSGKASVETMSQMFETTDANLVLTLEEISNLAAEGGKPADTLTNVVGLIAGRFQSDVCSAYLLEPDRSNVVLAASVGLHPSCIGTLRMPLHEGLTGLVAEQVKPVAVADVRSHPRFKYFREAGEDEFHSFLGVPLVDRGVLQGVLVVQTREPRTYHEHEIRMLTEAANQVAPVVERSANCRSLHRSRPGTALGSGAQSLVELGS